MNFIKIIIASVVLLIAMSYTSSSMAQYGYYYQPRVYNYSIGYQPIVQWGFEGTRLNINGAVVSPNRRYVRIGIGGTSFSRYDGYYNYNLRTGNSRYYNLRRGRR